VIKGKQLQMLQMLHLILIRGFVDLKSYKPDMSYNQEHLVEINLQYKNFKASVVYSISGNIAGASVLKSAIENFEDGDLDSFPTENELNQKHLDFSDPENEFSSAETVYLFSEDGSNIGFSHDDELLGDLVVGAQIIDYKP
jgi:hypothetical protein